MTPEYANQLIRENSQLRQKNDETAVYVARLEDNQAVHLATIRRLEARVKELEADIDSRRGDFFAGQAANRGD